ncbi:MAG TPA: cytochrome c oxidase subunit 3 [Stellaceae bacterium]|nr:cytochrome c oxidase subunit 3 [Stellaceae bacterium]
MAETSSAPEPEIQYASLAHQGETAEIGIWAFLSTEILFFGGMFLVYALYRQAFPIGFAEGSKDTKFIIGTVNLFILLTSSFTMAWAVELAGTEARRALTVLLLVTAALGLIFIGLKGFEYYEDVWIDHDFPGIIFPMSKPDARANELFWLLYWMLTGLHAVHLSIGVGLVLTFAHRAWRGAYIRYGKPIEILGYYWTFVDLMWVVLWTLIYLPGRNI